jgi:hypothetical protein
MSLRDCHYAECRGVILKQGNTFIDKETNPIILKLCKAGTSTDLMISDSKPGKGKHGERKNGSATHNIMKFIKTPLSIMIMDTYGECHLCCMSL